MCVEGHRKLGLPEKIEENWKHFFLIYVVLSEAGHVNDLIKLLKIVVAEIGQ